MTRHLSKVTENAANESNVLDENKPQTGKL
jgi:hypothetical protein